MGENIQQIINSLSRFFSPSSRSGRWRIYSEKEVPVMDDEDREKYKKCKEMILEILELRGTLLTQLDLPPELVSKILGREMRRLLEDFRQFQPELVIAYGNNGGAK